MRIELPDYLPLEAGSCRVIAEAGVNHHNSVEHAIELSRAAASAGAWAIKFQLYKAGSLAIRQSPKYWQDSSGVHTQYEAFASSDHLDYQQYGAVARACRRLGIIFFATPFDDEAVDTLEEIGVPLYKIASGDLTHRPLIEKVSATGKPVLLSTGAATVQEIADAIAWSGLGPDRLVLMACTLTYPTPDDDGNFARLEEFRSEFGSYLCGMSDHTLGIAGAWMTAALGGVCIEKHYTLDKTSTDVPDHRMSVDQYDLAEMVAAAGHAARLRGASWIGVRDSERPARTNARRSIVLKDAVAGGTRITREHLDFLRPGVGLPPSELAQVLGKVALSDLPASHVLRDTDIG